MTPKDIVFIVLFSLVFLAIMTLSLANIYLNNEIEKLKKKLEEKK